MTKPHIAIYGNVRIVRAYCDQCENTALIIRGKFSCCDSAFSDSPTSFKRICEPEFRRSVPTREMQKLILKIQQGCCFYCDRMFNSTVIVHHRKRKLKLCWDHLVPFAYSQNNNTENFVAACHLCNSWKSDRVFQTIEEAKVFLALKWASVRPDLYEEN